MDGSEAAGSGAGQATGPARRGEQLLRERRRAVRVDLTARDYERLGRLARKIGITRTACVRMATLARLARADAELDPWSAP